MADLCELLISPLDSHYRIGGVPKKIDENNKSLHFL